MKASPSERRLSRCHCTASSIIGCFITAWGATVTQEHQIRAGATLQQGAAAETKQYQAVVAVALTVIIELLYRHWPSCQQEHFLPHRSA